MKNAVLLSYPFARVNPTYGKNSVPLTVKAKKCISDGDSCNVSLFSLENHWGTHVDCPAHFFNSGKRLIDYPIEQWCCKKPLVWNRALVKKEILSVQHFNNEKLLSELGTCDSLFIKTGFAHKFRGKNEYCEENPGVSPDVGSYLRENYPNVKILGFDFISLSSFHNRELGRASHRAFLNPESKGDPLRVIEDMDLRMVNGNNWDKEILGAEKHQNRRSAILASVVIAPLFISDLDSGPCTVIGFTQ